MINFLKFKAFYFAISLTLLTLSIAGIGLFGLNPGLDFTGGALLELELTTDQEINSEDISTQIEEIIGSNTVQPVSNGILIKASEIKQENKYLIISTLKENFDNVAETRYETVGPILGKELLEKTVIAVILGSVLIMLYIGYQFKELKFGLSAILAMFHDILILVGAFAWLGYFFQVEVDSLFVTALRTTLSFSVHDTIVVFDRIRENSRKQSSKPFAEIVNIAITETLGRSLNNSMTIIFMLISLALLGGESIRFFVVALLIGTVIGTYSSTFTAAPLLTLIQTRFKK